MILRQGRFGTFENVESQLEKPAMASVMSLDH